eukprot:5763215-Prymnesium_polylepis.1
MHRLRPLPLGRLPLARSAGPARALLGRQCAAGDRPRGVRVALPAPRRAGRTAGAVGHEEGRLRSVRGGGVERARSVALIGRDACGWWGWGDAWP